MEKAYKEPTFLADKNHIIVLEAIISATNTAIPGSLEPFEVLVPDTSDGAAEKHLPITEINGSHVIIKVGSNSHPMSEEHSISFVCPLTQAGEIMRVYLSPDCEPVAHFTVRKGGIPAAVYAYCSLHSFQKTET